MGGVSFNKQGNYWKKSYRDIVEHYKSQAEAEKRRQSLENEFLMPYKVTPHPRSTNTSGELYIQYRSNRKPKPWVFEKVTSGKRITRYFSTPAEAIAFKHKYLGGN